MHIETSILLRCLWCNGYHCWKWTRWPEFKTWTRQFAFHIALILLGKVCIQLFSLQLGLFNLGIATGLREAKLWTQTNKTPLKNWPCVAPCSCGGVGIYIYIYIYIYYNSVWLSLSHLVGLWQTKCGIIWRVLNICDRAVIYGTHPVVADERSCN